MIKVARIALSLSALLVVATAATRFQSANPKVTVAAADVTVLEGQMAQIVLTLSSQSPGYTFVEYQTVGRSADAGVDFGASTGPVLFSPGDVSATISVPTYEDFENEKNEVFTVRLRSSQLGTPGGPIKVTIINQ